MNMLRILSVVFSMFIMNTFAQKATISGTIKDGRTKEALPGVNIAIQNTGQGSVTDIDGKFSMELDAGEQIVVFSYVGYEDRTEKFTLGQGETKTIDIILSESTNILNTVVVSGSKFEKKMSEEIVSVDVVKPIFLEKQHLTDLTGAISRNPGVKIIDGQINIRGGSGWSYGAGSRVLVLLDGLPTLNPAGGTNTSPNPMESVGQVEIIKGAASALYGSSAMNGIVNLRTAYATSEPKTTVTFFTSVNDNFRENEKYIDADGNIQSGDFEKRWWLQDSVTFLGGTLGKDTTLLNEYRTRPYTVGFSFSNRQKIGKLDLVIGGFCNKGVGHIWANNYKSGRFNINTRYRFSNKWNAGVNVNLNFSNGTSNFIWSGSEGINKYLPSALAIPTFFSAFNVFIDPFVNYSDSKGNQHKIMGHYFVSQNNNSNNQSNSSSMYYGEYQYQRRIEKINMTVTGGFAGNLSQSPGSPLYGSKDLYSSNFGFYLQADNKFWKRVSTSLGFRFESNKITLTERETKPVFRAGVNVEAAKYTFIRASFGQGYRFPTIAEKYVNTNLSQFAVVPNPFLTSETGYSAELGIKQGVKLGREFNAFIDLSGFYMQYKDMMEFTAVTPESGIPTPGNVVAFASQNVGNTRIYGTEASLMGEGKFFGFPSTMVLGYTFVVPKYSDYTEDRVDDVVDYNVLKYRFRHTLTAQWDIDFKGFGFGTNLTYASFIENYDALFNLIGLGIDEYRQTFLKENSAGKKDQNKYKGNTLWDLRSSYTFGKTSKYTLAFIINNVLNREFSLRPGAIEPNRVYTFRVDMKF